MTTNAERVHREFGQSLWYDNLERGLLRSGAFQALLDAGVRGCTSNPTIFEKAIRSSTEYEPALRRLAAAGASVEDIYYDLVVEDIQGAADALRPIYDGSERRDGYISVEVQPKHAADPEARCASPGSGSCVSQCEGVGAHCAQRAGHPYSSSSGTGDLYWCKGGRPTWTWS